MPFLCKNKCGLRPRFGRHPNGKYWDTCCRGCATGAGHDRRCSAGQAGWPSTSSSSPSPNPPHKCKRRCGRNRNGVFKTCCRACGKTDGTVGAHDRECDSRVPGDKKRACQATKLVQIANSHGTPAATVCGWGGDMKTLLPVKNLHDVWCRAWELCLRVLSSYAQVHGVPVSFVTGGWGTGVYKNSVSTVASTLFTVMKKYPQVVVNWVHYNRIDPTVEALATAAISQGAALGTYVSDMMQVGANLAKSGHVVFVHNFANGLQAGGGAVNGRTAQEEYLCQNVTNLLGSLLKIRPFYLPGEVPKDWLNMSVAVAITPNCWIAGDEEGRKKPFYVLSAAAPNMKKLAWRGWK